jgi:hypothetical protein
LSPARRVVGELEEDAGRLAVLGRAPELAGVDPWFNTPDGEPLRLAALRDRVVLLEFWTVACVNCRHTVPVARRRGPRGGGVSGVVVEREAARVRPRR